MANGVNAPYGLRAVRSINGSTWNGQTTTYPVASEYNHSIFTGDPVTFLQDGTIGRAFLGLPLVGTFMGCKYYDQNTKNYIFSPYWLANTQTVGGIPAEAMIMDDRSVVYSIQASNFGNGPFAQLGIAAINVGSNAEYAEGGVVPAPVGVAPNPAGGSTSTGQSGIYLNCSPFQYTDIPSPTFPVAQTISGATTYMPLKIIGLATTPGNQFLLNPQVTSNPTLPVGAFNIALVTLNSSMFQGNTANRVIPATITSTVFSSVQMSGGTTPGSYFPADLTSGAGGPAVLSSVSAQIYSSGVPFASAAAGASNFVIIYSGTSIVVSQPLFSMTQLIAATTAAAGTQTGFTTVGLPQVGPITLPSGNADVFALGFTGAQPLTGGDGAIVIITLHYTYF